jgi:prepilin-type N-terminal cleavage/methylation domain-containing protein
MSIKKSVGNVKGFTLVELLIVVAIIGVLASQGVPAYRRMIQKSKKGEAQNMLAAIGAGESAFFSEYGVYGNNLGRMGVQVDGQNTPGNFTYVASVDGCAQNAGAYVPVAGALNALPAAHPYFTDVVFGAVTVRNRIGRTTMNQACPAVAIDNTLAVRTYTAGAAGLIKGGSAAEMNGCTGGCDTWSMTQDRTLLNNVDGISN